MLLFFIIQKGEQRMKNFVTISRAHNYLRLFDYNQEFVAKVIMPFCRLHLYKYVQEPDPITGDPVWKVDNVFARFNNDKTEFRISSGFLSTLVDFMVKHNYPDEGINFITEPEIVPVPAKFKFKKGWGEPRENQIDYIAYQNAPGALKVNNASMGMGKSIMALITMVTFAKKTVFIMQPRYISVWIKAFGEQLDFKLEDVLILDNGTIDEMYTAFLQKKIDPSIVILPMTKVQMYLKKIKEFPELPSLDQIFSDFGFGLRIYDEAHEAFHQIYTSMLFGNVAKTLMLSATMKSDDKFTNNMYNIVIPPDIYLKATEHKQYIETYAYHYRIDQRRFFIGHKSMGNYSDIMFEKNMMRNKITQKFYLDMMYKSFEEYYLSRRKEGTKCIIFFTKTDTVERFKNYLLKKHPDLDVIDFTGLITKKKEMKNEYLKHEVVITTPGSCGTGKDIPGLITVLCSHNVSSIQRNDQIIGRLRPTEGKFDPYLPPIFVYFVCDDIPKHREYHDKRKTLFHSKSVLQKNIDSHCHLN